MIVNVMIFGQLADITAAALVQITDVQDTDSVIAQLCKTWPAFKNARYTIAVNKQHIHENTLLTDNATVALLPPFSGG